MKDTWDLLKCIYSEQYHIAPIVVDYIAVHDILLLCAEGRSVGFIARKQNIDQEYIEDVLRQFYYFTGLPEDIGFNVRLVYQKYRYNKYAFISVSRTLDPAFSESLYKFIFTINIWLDEIEKEIETYYATA